MIKRLRKAIDKIKNVLEFNEKYIVIEYRDGHIEEYNKKTGETKVIRSSLDETS